ncbi:hypothetical protein SLS62_010431 [Diatrype stigma]|uniref:Uncharacterized protein n=1 Tax=Diatrype stigma TaxID=117547 RepID=A0AAN9U8S8_9PEZI
MPRKLVVSRTYPHILPSPSPSTTSFGTGAMALPARPITPTDEPDLYIAAAAAGGSTPYRHSGDDVPSPVCEIRTQFAGAYTKCAEHSGQGGGPAAAGRDEQQELTPPATPIAVGVGHYQYETPHRPLQHAPATASTPATQRESTSSPVGSIESEPESPFTPEFLATTELGPVLALRGCLAQRQRQTREGRRAGKKDDDDDGSVRGHGDGDGNTEDQSFSSNYLDEDSSFMTEKTGLLPSIRSRSSFSSPRKIYKATVVRLSSRFSPPSPLAARKKDVKSNELAPPRNLPYASSRLSLYQSNKENGYVRPMTYKLPNTSSLSLKEKVSGFMPRKLTHSTSWLTLQKKEDNSDLLALNASRSASYISLEPSKDEKESDKPAPPPQLPYSDSIYDLSQYVAPKTETAVPTLRRRDSITSLKGAQPAVGLARLPSTPRSFSSPVPVRVPVSSGPSHQSGFSPLRRHPVQFAPTGQTGTAAKPLLVRKPSLRQLTPPGPTVAPLKVSAAAPLTHPLPQSEWLSTTPSLPETSALRDYQPPLIDLELSPRGGHRLSTIWSVCFDEDNDDDDDDEQEASGSGSGLGLKDHGAADHEDDGCDTATEEVGGDDVNSGKPSKGKGRDTSFHSHDGSGSKEAEGKDKGEDKVPDDDDHNDYDDSIGFWRSSMEESEYEDDAIVETAEVITIGVVRKGMARIVSIRDHSKS